MIKSYFDSIDCDFDVRIVNETEPLGTGGALGNCRDVVNGTFACFNGDIISSLDVGKLLSYTNQMVESVVWGCGKSMIQHLRHCWA